MGDKKSDGRDRAMKVRVEVRTWLDEPKNVSIIAGVIWFICALFFGLILGANSWGIGINLCISPLLSFLVYKKLHRDKIKEEKG